MESLFPFLSHQLSHALGWAVLHSIWQAVIIALLLGVLLIMLRRHSAALRYSVANAALCTLLGVSLITFGYYYQKRDNYKLTYTPDTEELAKCSAETTLTLDTREIPSNNVATAGLSLRGWKQYFNQHIYLIASLWLLGVALCLLRLLSSISYVYFLKSRFNFPVDEYWQSLLDSLRQKASVLQQIDIMESPLVRSPLVVGHLRPMILFPIGVINRLDEKEVAGILAHELAHIMRHDYLLNILQSIIESLFYFHPAVWWISAQIRNERENCCDDIAIGLSGNSFAYAKSLVSLQEMAYYSPQMAMAFVGQNRKQQLMLRVQRVLNQPKSTINIMEKFTASSALALLMLLLAVSNSSSINDAANKNNANEITAENVEYLKYWHNETLDSLPVGQDIKDGAYTLESEEEQINLVVKDHEVIQFNINGLEVAGKDIPKFEKLIQRAITPKSDEPEMDSQMDAFAQAKAMRGMPNVQPFVVTENLVHTDEGDFLMSIFDDNHITYLEKNGKISELHFDESGANHLLINDQQSEPKTVELRNGELIIGGLKGSLSELKKLGWEIGADKASLQPIGGFQNIQVVSHEDGDPAHMKEHLEQLGQLNLSNEQLEAMANLDMEAINQIGNNMADAQNFHYDSNFQYNHPCDECPEVVAKNNCGSDWESEIETQLRKDGYLKNGRTDVIITNNQMLVGEKELSKKQRTKYIKLYERASRQAFNGDTYLTLTFD